jgi:hypothetical protein
MATKYRSPRAEVLIYLANLAQMTGTDLQNEVERKLAGNVVRACRPDERGVLLRADSPV